MAPDDGDLLVGLLGRSAEDGQVEACLDRLARGTRPELDPEDPECYFDWIVLNEIGLKLGFDDEADLFAYGETLRRKGPVLLSGVWFYADTPDMAPCPLALPFGLDLSDRREQVRSALADYELSRRYYIADSWRLPSLVVTVTYRNEAEGVESVYCRLPEREWPEPAILPATLAPSDFHRLFGLRWSSLKLREGLSAFQRPPRRC